MVVPMQQENGIKINTIMVNEQRESGIQFDKKQVIANVLESQKQPNRRGISIEIIKNYGKLGKRMLWVTEDGQVMLMGVRTRDKHMTRMILPVLQLKKRTSTIIELEI